MLPSTGLFKAIACPFFETGKCVRPFCHYKHVRKDDAPTDTALSEHIVQPQIPAIKLLETPAVYKPTPKILLASTTQSEGPGPDDEEPTNKKQRLEYVPTPKTIGKDHYGKDRTKYHHKTTEYQPEAVHIHSEITAEPQAVPKNDIDDDGDELDEIAKLIRSTAVDNIDESDRNLTPYVPSLISTDEILDLEPKSQLNLTTNGATKENGSRSRTHSSSSKDRDKRSNGDNHRSKHDSRSKDKKSRSKGEDQKHKGKDDKVRDKDDKDKTRDDRSKDKNHRSKDKDKLDTSKSSKSSSSSSSRHSTTKSSHRSDRKNSSDDKRSTEHRTSKSSRNSKSSEHSRNNKAAISKQSRSETSHSKSSNKTTSAKSTLELTMPSPSSVFDSESDEDDVMAQCRQIFEDYKSKPPITKDTPIPEAPNKESDDVENYEDPTRKKRVAYDGAELQRPAQKTNAKLGKNYSHIAMESLFKRQEVVRIQLEKMEEKKAAEKAANEKRLAALEAERVTKARHAISSRPNLIVSTSGAHSQPHVAPPTRVGTIKPASNILAMQRAKEKIDQMRAAKMPTVARTAPKAEGRVAHMTSVTTQDLKPSPPVLEPQSTKISFNIRMQYYNLMVKHCLTIYDDCNDAWERAQTVELGVFKKCNTPVIYKKSATLAINTLRKEALEAGNVSTDKSKTISHDVILAGKHGQNTSWNKSAKSLGPTKNPLDIVSTTKAFDMIYDLRLTEEQLHDCGYPRPGDRPGWAKVHTTKTTAQPNNENDRYCRRCGKIFNISHYEEDAIDQCNYHAKTPAYRRGHTEHFHRCCQQPSGTPGCMYANYHVSENSNPNRLTGYVKTIAKPDDYRTTRADVFALDCEMCYTTSGLELTRVTVVDYNQKTVYDALVKPDNKVVDYNTTYSGITEQMLEKESRTLRDVQAVLLSMFHAKTILIGHSLDSDMKALKLLHDVIVDTSVLYPHKMGLPMKRALKTLCIENLKRIIQESESGHDSAEDAEVCIQLVRHYLQNLSL